VTADGGYTVTAQVVNQAGAVGSMATKLVTVDNTAPAETISMTSMTVPEGSQASGLTTTATTGVTINGSFSAPLAAVTADGVAAEQLQISLDGGNSWQAVTSFSGNDWSYAIPGALNDGANSVQARVVDLAGNVGPTQTQTITVAAAPTVTSFTLAMAATSDDGYVSDDSVTTVYTPVFNGSFSTADAATQTALQAGQLSATLFVDSNGDGLPGAGEQILASGVPVSAQSSTSGVFSAAPSMLVSGQTYAVKAVIENAGLASTTTALTSAQIKPATAITNGAISYLNTSYAGLGYSLTSIADFNGDGYSDYIVSAPRQHVGNVTSGTSTLYLLYGSANGLPNLGSLSNLTAAQGIVINATSPKDQGVQGSTVHDIGDFNGDGLSDVAIFSSLNDRVYVLYGEQGNTTSAISLATMDSAQGFSLTYGGSGSSYAGHSGGGADINGDGYSDLLMGAPDGGTAGTGAVYVIYGHAGTQANMTFTKTAVSGAGNGYAIVSGANGLGTSMQTVGDVNGDGYADYLVAAPAKVGVATGAGSAYLIFGGPNGLTQGSTANVSALTSQTGITLQASNTDENLGGAGWQASGYENADAYYAQFHSINALGNIDGSGRNAIAIGSPGAISPDNGDGAGAVYVFYSQPAGFNWANISLPTYSAGTWINLSGLQSLGGFVIYSSSFARQANASTDKASDLGFSVNSAGDVNGDGITDFLIGAPMATGNDASVGQTGQSTSTTGSGAGMTFLVFGEAGGLPQTSPGVVDLDQLVINGPNGTGQPFGTPGTAVEYSGAVSTATNGGLGGGALGTDVTGGDWNGSGISGYSFGSWGMSLNSSLVQAGATAIFNGTTAYLTQPYSNVDSQIYYAGDNPASVNQGLAVMNNGVDLIATGAGNNDWVHGIGTDTTGSTATNVQHDAVNGGAGDDHIGIAGVNFTSVHGGNGWNTLVFEGSNLTLNLTDMGLRVQGIDQFDLNNQSNTAATDPRGLFTGATTSNTLQLSLSDVLNEPNGTVGPTTQQMTILGDGNSAVQLDGGLESTAGSNWSVTGTQSVNGVAFDIYHNSTMGANTVADLLIQQGVHVI
jgi:hypothetical protein